MKSLFFLGFFFLIAFRSVADESYKKIINFEWEPVAGAKQYHIQFINQKNNKEEITDFYSEVNSYRGPIPPGYYKMQLRSLDARGVPGIWSKPVEFPVLLDQVIVKSPQPNLELSSKKKDTEEISFQWLAVLGADKYQISIKDTETNTEFLNQSISDLKALVSLPVGKKYVWSVTAMDLGNLKSEQETIGDITLIGKKLDAPKINTPETQFVREISWTNDEYAQFSQVELQKWDSKNKKWLSLVTEKEFTGTKVVISSNWPGGQYRLNLKNSAILRPTSETATLNFKVKNGDRSIAAEHTYVLKKSIDRVDGWYGIASWFISMINYSSSYKGLNPAYSILGGTGRLGAGWFKEGLPWGFSGVVDISGFLKDESSKSSFIYNSFYLNGIYRKTVNETHEFRAKAGLFYKELPQTVANVEEISSYFNSNNRSLSGFKGTSNENISMLGPQFGLEYWFSLTPKIGLQANANWYYATTAIKLPFGGKNFKPTLSDEYGLLGSYKLTSKLTGLLGVTYRKDQASYVDESTTNSFNLPSANTEYNSNTTVNTSAKAFYFSLFAEYDF